MSDAAHLHVPEVSISAFKANPIAYAATGAVITVHNRARMRVIPLTDDVEQPVAEVKARLRLLNALVDDAETEEERSEIARERDRDRLDAPR